jgi:hypothetical protein
MKVSYEHIVSIPKSKVIEIYLDDDYYVGQLKNTGALTIQILATGEVPGGGKTRKTKVTAPSRVPAMLRKSDTDEYTDDCKVDAAGSSYSYKITPSTFADQFLLSGGIEFVEAGNDTKLIFTTQIEVKIPFVGKKLEQVALEQTEKEVLAQVAFLKKWPK